MSRLQENGANNGWSLLEKWHCKKEVCNNKNNNDNQIQTIYWVMSPASCIDCNNNTACLPT